MTTPTINPNAPGSAGQSSTYAQQVPKGAPNVFSRLQYVQAVLQQGGWPDTPDNEQFLLNLAQREHAAQDTTHPAAAFNLFDSEKPMANSTFFNHTSANAGVQNYADFNTGVAAAVATLKQGYYKNIQAALSQGNAATQDAAGKFATDLHSWSGGAYTTVAGAGGQDAPISATGKGDQGTGVAGVDGSTGLQGANGPTGNIDGFLKAQAPELAKALGGDPQVAGLLASWASNGLSDQEFQNELEQTKWWKTTSQSQRTLLVQKATDPGTFAQDQANQTGVDTNTINSLYKAYAIPVTQQKLAAQLGAVLSGTKTLQAVQSDIVGQAKTLYATNPQLSSFIDETHSVKDWADPYLASAASLLGLNQNSIDLNQPMWQKVLNPATDPKTGASTGSAMSIDQWNQTLRTDSQYGFDGSQNGTSTASAFANQLTSRLTGASI